jgi:tRNA(adenine34) deaminase
MCYGAIYWSKIDTIVYGASDNKRGFTSYNLQMDRNVKTISGIMESESKNLLNKFFKKIRD